VIFHLNVLLHLEPEYRGAVSCHRATPTSWVRMPAAHRPALFASSRKAKAVVRFDSWPGDCVRKPVSGARLFFIPKGERRDCKHLRALGL